jgi:hypothetical protein
MPKESCLDFIKALPCDCVCEVGHYDPLKHTCIKTCKKTHKCKRCKFLAYYTPEESFSLESQMFPHGR